MNELITRDPVCGMTVDPTAGKPETQHEGKTIHFCHHGCHDKFVAEPAAYLTSVDPVCGMTVERSTAAAALSSSLEQAAASASAEIRRSVLIGDLTPLVVSR